MGNDVRAPAGFDSRLTYQGVEAPEGFADEGALEMYRSHCLAKAAVEGRFLEAMLPVPGTAFEIGCGNGRNLFHLARRGLIKSAVGIDIAESRIAFAKAWAGDLGLDDRIELRAADALTLPAHAGGFDLIICITAAFGYFEPLEAGGDRKVMDWITANLRPGGRLVMELYLYPSEIALLRQRPGGPLRHWAELPEKDPFRFYLHERWWDGEKRFLYHKKLFIHRSGRVDEGRGDCQRIYTLSEISDLVRSAGLLVEKACGDWEGTPYREGDELLVLQARKSGQTPQSH